MIISFSVFKDKIESGEKTQTIRRYSAFQWKRFCNAKKYQLYWGNPRNGGTLIKEVEPSMPPFLIAFNNSDREPNINIIGASHDQPLIPMDYFAHCDGFRNAKEMFDWFYQKYGHEMYQTKFMVLRWKP